jgi:hypothetical protein
MILSYFVLASSLGHRHQGLLFTALDRASPASLHIDLALVIISHENQALGRSLLLHMLPVHGWCRRWPLAHPRYVARCHLRSKCGTT